MPASSKKVQDDTDSRSCSTAVTISQEPFTPEYESETTTSASSLSKAAAASINKHSYPDISSLSDSDIQNTDVKMKLLTGTWKKLQTIRHIYNVFKFRGTLSTFPS